jgi:predicted kinase
MKLVCLIGIPGSGKTTLVHEQYVPPFWVHASADKYDGLYDEHNDIQPELLSKAHGYCFRHAINALAMNSSVVIDNTNTRIMEISPYLLLAQAYEVEAELVHVKCDVKRAHARNVHGVPIHVVARMADSIDAMLDALPPWWPKPRVIHNG